ncbi:LGFP repeat-containing protein [Corynebacterium tuscaniense]|uniref:LGFP repeat-containing protein n=1 Tax=Corynebacterium tuscaniense TaxID=302449 RepID=UPI001238CACE|nr:hypothetical protein [Corynebacterium tuscaniense]KAA8730844.1 hypothetical protein F4V54_09820 [Corynebacterium tuscaniense]
MNRKIAASVTALALAVSLAACSNEGDDQEDKNTTATETTSSSESGTAEADNDTAENDAADSDTVELTTKDGKKVLVPAKAANATDELGLKDWGEPVTVESREDGTTFIAYDGGNNIVYTPKVGPVAIVGEIARVWKEQGGLDSEIGAPTSTEKALADGTGWAQEFQNGTIEWREENGVFAEHIS